jgi:hypothetical protein
LTLGSWGFLAMARRWLLLLVFLGLPALAQTPEVAGAKDGDAKDSPEAKDDESEALAKKSQNPVADLITVPFQSNTNFGVGPSNAVQEVLNIQPVIPIHAGDFNIITRTIIPLVWQPNLGPGEMGTTFGLGNINATFFFSPAKPGALIWGVGPIFGFPTNTSPAVGTAKWTFGPSVVLLGTPGPWTIGVLANNVWSWAGGGSQNVNSLLVQYFVNYNFKGGWYLTSSPIITANWLAAPYSNKWTFPVGGGFGKLQFLGKLPLNLSAAFYYNIWHPDVGPTSQLRVQVAFLF